MKQSFLLILAACIFTINAQQAPKAFRNLPTPQGSPLQAPSDKQKEQLKNHVVSRLIDVKQTFTDDFAMFTLLHAEWPYNFTLTQADKDKLLKAGYSASVIEDFYQKGLWIRPKNTKPLAGKIISSEKFVNDTLENAAGDDFIRVEHRCQKSDFFKICNLVFVNQADHPVQLIYLHFDKESTRNLNYITTRFKDSDTNWSPTNVLHTRQVNSRGRYGQKLVDFYDTNHYLAAHPLNQDKRRHDIWKVDHSFTGTSEIYTKRLGGPNNKAASIMVVKPWESSINLTLDEAGAPHQLGIFYCYAYRTFVGELKEACKSFKSKSRGLFYRVGGDVKGLNTGEIQIQLNGGEIITVTKDNSFQFQNKIEHSQDYKVKIVRQPQGSQCLIANEEGVIKGDVSNIKIRCKGVVGGIVKGLDGELSLRLNGSEKLAITKNGKFIFDATLQYDEKYNIEIITQPLHQTCEIDRPDGVVKNSAVSVTINCYSSSNLKVDVKGLKGSLTLKLNDDSLKTIAKSGISFFDFKLDQKQEYHVKIASQPSGQECKLNNAEGIFDQKKSVVIVICKDKVKEQSEKEKEKDSKSKLKSNNSKKSANSPTGKKGFHGILAIDGKNIPKEKKGSNAYDTNIGRVGFTKDEKGNRNYQIYILDDNNSHSPREKFFISIRIYAENIFQRFELTNQENKKVKFMAGMLISGQRFGNDGKFNNIKIDQGYIEVTHKDPNGYIYGSFSLSGSYEEKSDDGKDINKKEYKINITNATFGFQEK